MVGFDEAVAYIHDYMINNPPFDVRQLSSTQWRGRSWWDRELWVSRKEHVWPPSSLLSYVLSSCFHDVSPDHIPHLLSSILLALPSCMNIWAGADIQLINQNAHPSFPPHPSLIAPKFLISVGGFLPVPKEPSLSNLFPLPASLPTLHIVGRNDIVVTEEKSRTLWEKCENSRVEYHDGGESFFISCYNCVR